MSRTTDFYTHVYLLLYPFSGGIWNNPYLVHVYFIICIDCQIFKFLTPLCFGLCVDESVKIRNLWYYVYVLRFKVFTLIPVYYTSKPSYWIAMCIHYATVYQRERNAPLWALQD